MISGNIRKSCGKNESFRTRKQGMLPAVIYGAHKDNLNVEIGTMEIINEIKRNGEHSTLELNIDGRSERVMVKELQKDPVNHRPLHLDLQRIEMGQIIHTRVPVLIKGDKSFKNSRDIVQIQQSEIEIECAADKLPRHIVTDVSGLHSGEKLSLKDLKAPDGVNIIGNPYSVIVSIRNVSENTIETPQKEETPVVYA
jgi:large subunit ribosomal protein L25